MMVLAKFSINVVVGMVDTWKIAQISYKLPIIVPSQKRTSAILEAAGIEIWHVEILELPDAPMYSVAFSKSCSARK